MEPKPVPPSPRQQALFEGFFVEDEGQSRTLDVYDALPKFSLSWERGTGGEENLRVFKEVAWALDDGTKVWITEAEQPLPFGWSWRR